MSLRSLLLSSDEKTVRVLRRVLSDLEIDLDHSPSPDIAVRKLTRQRFESVIVDCVDPNQAQTVLQTAKASPTNARAVAILLVDANLGLRGGFDLGGHFVLHKPLHPERARASFRAVRALMKQERRRQTRINVEIPVICIGSRSSRKFNVKTIDLCEGGMAVRYSGRLINESPVHFALQLPGTNQKIQVDGEFAWEGDREQAGVRFTSVSDEYRFMLREWIQGQLADPQSDDPPLVCRLADLTTAACYLETESPFPVGTRVSMRAKNDALELHACGTVRVMHPDFGMGVEFDHAQETQRDHVCKLIETLRTLGERSPELLVEPELLDQSAADNAVETSTDSDDALLELFRTKSDVPADVFLAEMRHQRQDPQSA